MAMDRAQSTGAPIAYFGTGLLGSGFVRKLLERGETVHVWNRSPEKARALEADGAKAFDDPAAAIAGVKQLHLTLSDDAAVDAVLEPLAGVIATDTIVVDHTTTAPTPTAERIRRWAERGVTFVHAPVFMGPQNAREATGFMLISGDPAVRERVKPLLAPMTGTLLDLGDDPSRAATFKLMGNLVLISVSGVLSDMFALARAGGVAPDDAAKLFDAFNPGAMIPGRVKAMAAGKTQPASFELTMARKDLRLAAEEAQRNGHPLDVVPAVGALFDRYIAAGLGRHDTGIVGSGKA